MGQNGRNGPKYLWKRLVLAAILAPGRKVHFYGKNMISCEKIENMQDYVIFCKIPRFSGILRKVHFQGTHAGADISWKIVEFLDFSQNGEFH